MSDALCGNTCVSVPVVENPPPLWMNWFFFVGHQGCLLLTTSKELILLILAQTHLWTSNGRRAFFFFLLQADKQAGIWGIPIMFYMTDLYHKHPCLLSTSCLSLVVLLLATHLDNLNGSKSRKIPSVSDVTTTF